MEDTGDKSPKAGQPDQRIITRNKDRGKPGQIDPRKTYSFEPTPDPEHKPKIMVETQSPKDIDLEKKVSDIVDRAMEIAENKDQEETAETVEELEEKVEELKEKGEKREDEAREMLSEITETPKASSDTTVTPETTSPPPAETPIGIVPGMEVIQRDSGESFRIIDTAEVRGRKLVHLVGPEGQKVTLGEDDLKDKLTTEGSAWSPKPSETETPSPATPEGGSDTTVTLETTEAPPIETTQTVPPLTDEVKKILDEIDRDPSRINFVTREDRRILNENGFTDDEIDHTTADDIVIELKRRLRAEEKTKTPAAETAELSERESVLSAFNSAYAAFDNYPAERLTPKQIAAREQLKAIKARTIDLGKASYINRFKAEDGTSFQQREYVPVDELILFLRERVKSGELSEDEIKEYRDWERTLHKNSQEYYRGAKKKEPDRLLARIRQEQERISADPNLTSENTHDDFLEAGRILFERRDLIIPPRREPLPPVPVPPEPVPVPPEPVPVPPEPVPVPPEPVAPPEDVRYSTVIATRRMEMRKRAEDMASEQIREEQRRGSMFNPLNWARKTRTRIFEEYYRQQYIARAEDAMVTNNNTYLEIDLVRNTLGNINRNIDQERAAGSAKVRELQEGGASQAEILRGGREEIREATGEIKALLMNEIIRPVVNGEITDYAQIQERLRQFVQNNPDNADIRELFGADSNRYGEIANYFATDLLELGQQIRTDLAAHKFAIEELDNRVTINLANADWAAESQPRFTMADRAVAWAQRGNRRGLLGNPAFVGAVTSIGVYGAMRAAGAGTKAMQFAVPGSGALTGALFSAIRRNYDLKVDRASDQRTQAYAREAGPEAPRREALRRYSYDMASVDVLMNGGNPDRYDLGNPNSQGIRQLLESDLSQNENREALMRRMAEIRTRLDFSGAQNVDLLTFRGEHEVQQGRLELVRGIAEARIALRNSGLSDEAINTNLAARQGEWNTHFDTDRRNQDRRFAIYRYRNAVGAAIFGGAAGLGAGFVAKEILEQSGANPFGVFNEAGKGIDKFKDLFNQGGDTKVGDLNLNIAGDNNITVTGPDGNTILNHGMALQENGHIFARTDETPQNVIDHFKEQGFKTGDDPTIHETIFEGNTGTVQSSFGGHEALVPQGTHWTQDAGGNWDLTTDNGNRMLADNVRFENGQVVFDSATSRIDMSNIHTETIHTEVLGPNGEWTKHATNVNHREWYSYDKPGSQQNELRFDTYKDGDKVTFDMTRMRFGYQKELSPNPIDVSQVIANHEAGWYFTNPNDQQNGLWISDGADGVWDGKLTLDANASPDLKVNPADLNSMSLAEASKIILNEQALQKYPNGNIATEVYSRQDVFNIGQEGKYGFIEAGRIQTHPEGNVLQSFATIRGSGPTPATIDTTIFRFDAPPIINETPTLDLIPPGNREIPIIPFPFSPRHPLEELLFLYGYGGEYSTGKLGWIDREEYKKRRSETLNQNPHARLDETKEIADYLSRLDPEYRDELEKMDEMIGTPMSPETRTVITIPTFGEGKIITKTLEQFLSQKDNNGDPINPALFEILVYENDTESRPKDETEDEVKRFRINHPELKVHYTYKRWGQNDIDSGINTVGNGRKYLCDLALLRNSKRTDRNGELIIINNDADLEGISPKYVADVIGEFDSKNYLDTIVGKRNLPDWALGRPNVRAGQRMWEIFDSVMRQGAGKGIPANEREKGWTGLIGENSAMRASIYAAVGGYVPTAKLAEDIHLGDMIRVARNYDDRRFEYLNRLVTVKNPRRYLAAVAAGIPVYHMYGDYHENKDLRNLDNKDLMRMIPEKFDVDKFQKDIDAIWQAKYSSFQHLGGKFDQIFQRAMGFMGVEYKIENGHAVITDATKLRNYLSSSSSATPRSRPARRPTPSIPTSPSAPPTARTSRVMGAASRVGDAISRAADTLATRPGPVRQGASEETGEQRIERENREARESEENIRNSALRLGITEGEALVRIQNDAVKAELQPIADKLNSNPVGIWSMLGRDVILTSDEIDRIDSFLTESTQKAESNPQLQEVHKLITDNRGGAAFDVSLFVGNAVVGDATIETPSVVNTTGGPQIHVPPETYRLWKAEGGLISARRDLEEAKKGGNTGRPADSLGEAIKDSLTAFY